LHASRCIVSSERAVFKEFAGLKKLQLLRLRVCGKRRTGHLSKRKALAARGFRLRAPMGATRSKSERTATKEITEAGLIAIAVTKADGSTVLIHLRRNQHVRAIKEAIALREGIRGSQQQLYIIDDTRGEDIDL
jgi:hypothetical protein